MTKAYFYGGGVFLRWRHISTAEMYSYGAGVTLASKDSAMSEQQRRGVRERWGHRGGPGQETMDLGIQVGGGASSSYGG